MTNESAPSSQLYASADFLADSERWYVARTLPQRELHAARQLNNQNFRTFAPRFWKNCRHARKVETISAPLFPRYIFVVVDRNRDRWRSINGTLGVDRLLMYGGEPQAVPLGVVEELNRRHRRPWECPLRFPLEGGGCSQGHRWALRRFRRSIRVSR